MTALSQTRLKIYMAVAAAEQIQESVLPLESTWNFKKIKWIFKKLF